MGGRCRHVMPSAVTHALPSLTGSDDKGAREVRAETESGQEREIKRLRIARQCDARRSGTSEKHRLIDTLQTKESTIIEGTQETESGMLIFWSVH